MKEKVKPCPFCGGEAKYMKVGWVKGTPSEFADWVMIICPDCHCVTEAYKDINELTALWNKRAKNVNDYKRLSSCPHCGGKANVSMITRGYYKVECANDDYYECCHTASGISTNKERAITAWNRRAGQ